MIRLSLPQEPYWLDLAGGARVKVKPLTSADHVAAHGHARQDADAKNGIVRDVDGKCPDETDMIRLNADYFQSFAIHLALDGIVEWEGVGDKDGNLAEVTPENIKTLAMTPGINFATKYTEFMNAVKSEGNA
ncbi:MAG TPA: hypothetical protein DEQ40_16400 [Oxalobacteraceae bacterium]|jgi:hypothetical protein|nr:hypothetical protein [Oxalobacteraceae bacterium]